MEYCFLVLGGGGTVFCVFFFSFIFFFWPSGYRSTFLLNKHFYTRNWSYCFFFFKVLCELFNVCRMQMQNSDLNEISVST